MGQVGLVPSNYLLELSQFLTQDVGGKNGTEGPPTNGSARATNGWERKTNKFSSRKTSSYFVMFLATMLLRRRFKENPGTTVPSAGGSVTSSWPRRARMGTSLLGTQNQMWVFQIFPSFLWINQYLPLDWWFFCVTKSSWQKQAFPRACGEWDVLYRATEICIIAAARRPLPGDNFGYI